MMWTLEMGGVGTESENVVKVKFGQDVESNEDSGGPLVSLSSSLWLLRLERCLLEELMGIGTAIEPVEDRERLEERELCLEDGMERSREARGVS